MARPRFLNPFRDTYQFYLDAGWLGPLPLPHGQKHPPPIGFNKRDSKYPKPEDFVEWATDGKAHNICVRAAGVTVEHELFGIDVDNYIKGGKEYKGGEQLTELEERLGPLPLTWISSARTDGISGIRHYRVPRGLEWRGKIADNIDPIRKGWHYSMVWPSVHPDVNDVVWWFDRVAPTEENRALWSGRGEDLPDARELPIMPDAWIDYLTQGRMKFTDRPIDMDSSLDDIYAWADNAFHGDDDTEPCSKMREKLDIHISKIIEEASSHPLITAAHWNLLHLAFEGHLGWVKAVNELDQHFAKVCLERKKRDEQEIVDEAFRSRAETLRQIKKKSDNRVAIGAEPVDACCARTGACGDTRSYSGPPGNPYSDVPGGSLKAVPDYEMNDDGNAQHLLDMFSGVRYAEGTGWIIWHEGKEPELTDSGVSAESHPHWERDELGNQAMRRMWHVVKERQLGYAEGCKAQYDNEVRIFAGQTGPKPPSLIAARAEWQKWAKFSEQSGMNRQSENAIKALMSRLGVSIDPNSLDRNERLLGVANGVLELPDDGEVRLRNATMEDYITLNTNVAWEQPSKFAQDIWQEYLDTFVPDKDLQRALQIAMGHCLLGGNPEKKIIVLWGPPDTGKSTLITGLEAATGDYCEAVNQSIFQQHKLNPILADAIKKRVIVCSEFDEKDALSASMVKQLTSGHDKIRAEKKGSNAKFEGVAQCVPVLATNTVPKISGADKALENRLHTFPFSVVPKHLDKTQANVIRNVCASAILWWLVDGFKQYRVFKELPVTEAMQVTKEQFMSQLDYVNAFKEECIEPQINPTGYVSRTEMFNHYERWWRDEQKGTNFEKLTKTAFTQRLKSLGVESPEKKLRIEGSEPDRWWVGVRLIQPKSNVLSMTRPGVPVKVVQVEQSGTDDNA
jgi:P4 family phage/plasmid primase-like protien